MIDEAHRLRNVYKPSNVIANTLKQALATAPKLLLTATPLQNSLLELFGLVSIIDDQVFGDLKSFREQFSDLTQEQVFADAEAPPRAVCHRTLRRQVTAYVSYTQRLPLVEQFTPDEPRTGSTTWSPTTCAATTSRRCRPSQRTLMTLVMRKLLASSTFAIAGALDTLVDAAEGRRSRSRRRAERIDRRTRRGLRGAWTRRPRSGTTTKIQARSRCPTQDREALAREIADLEQFRDLADVDHAQRQGRGAAEGAARRRSTRPTELGAREEGHHLHRVAEDAALPAAAAGRQPVEGRIVLFNGSNTDERSRAIYAEWRDTARRHRPDHRLEDARTCARPWSTTSATEARS